MESVFKKIVFVFMSIFLAQTTPLLAIDITANAGISDAMENVVEHPVSKSIIEGAIKPALRQVVLAGRALGKYLTTSSPRKTQNPSSSRFPQAVSTPPPIITDNAPMYPGGCSRPLTYGRYVAEQLELLNKQYHYPPITNPDELEKIREAAQGINLLKTPPTPPSYFAKVKTCIPDYVKSTSLYAWIEKNPTLSKIIAGYVVAGYLYVRVIKRIQLNSLYKKFLSGTHAAQNGRFTDPTWVACQDILRNAGRGYKQHPDIHDAVDYMKDLNSSIIKNKWLDRIFLPHVVCANALKNEKIFWVL